MHSHVCFCCSGFVCSSAVVPGIQQSNSGQQVRPTGTPLGGGCMGEASWFLEAKGLTSLVIHVIQHLKQIFFEN